MSLNNLNGLNEQQRKQVEQQLEEHRHEKYETDIDLGERKLENFSVYPNVLRPEKMVAQSLAKYLYENREAYKEKDVLDMGCGSGIQGITMGVGGARQVTFSDISTDAIANTKENIEKLKLENKSFVIQGDLFENIKGKFDCIVFNHPFFPAKPIEDVLVSRTMLDEGDLLVRFLTESKNYLKENGSIIMPYFHIAGEENDPAIQAPAFDYEVSTLLSNDVGQGVQKGLFSIFELRSKNGK